MVIPLPPFSCLRSFGLRIAAVTLYTYQNRIKGVEKIGIVLPSSQYFEMGSLKKIKKKN